MTLNEIAIGGLCKVVRLHGMGALKRRIMDMGITKGTEIKVVKIAPLGDPMELNVRGYDLSVRKTRRRPSKWKPCNGTLPLGRVVKKSQGSTSPACGKDRKWI